jgi:hypothetical protein
VPSLPDVEHRQTKEIGSAEIQRLPSQLTYRQLVKLWGPASIGDPCFTYRSKIDGITLAVFIGDPPLGAKETSIEDLPISSMYFIDMRSFSLHAWGEEIFPVFDPFAEPASKNSGNEN